MQCKAEQRKAKQSRAKHSLSTDASREAPVDKRARRCLCLANLEGQAKWAKAIFEGVPTLRHPGLGTLATGPTGMPGLGTLA